MEWEELYTACMECRRCPLWEGRGSVVFGTGPRDAQVMLIGEGPGEAEDREGLPFVGPAGQLLSKLLAATGIGRDEVYIANIIKCRTPANRDPKPDETEACIGFLRNQVALLRPRIIVCLGRIAATRIISPDFRISRERGQWIERSNCLITATYHPSALLRDPSKKADSYFDMLKVAEKIKELNLKGLYTAPRP